MLSVATPFSLFIAGSAVPGLKNVPPIPRCMFTNSSARFQPVLVLSAKRILHDPRILDRLRGGQYLLVVFGGSSPPARECRSGRTVLRVRHEGDRHRLPVHLDELQRAEALPVLGHQSSSGRMRPPCSSGTIELVATIFTEYCAGFADSAAICRSSCSVVRFDVTVTPSPSQPSPCHDRLDRGEVVAENADVAGTDAAAGQGRRPAQDGECRGRRRDLPDVHVKTLPGLFSGPDEGRVRLTRRAPPPCRAVESAVRAYDCISITRLHTFASKTAGEGVQQNSPCATKRFAPTNSAFVCNARSVMAEVRSAASPSAGAPSWRPRLRPDDPRREFLVLLGPSGCGKTTTMRMIAGLRTRPKATSSSTAAA